MACSSGGGVEPSCASEVKYEALQTRQLGFSSVMHSRRKMLHVMRACTSHSAAQCRHLPLPTYLSLALSQRSTLIASATQRDSSAVMSALALSFLASRPDRASSKRCACRGQPDDGGGEKVGVKGGWQAIVMKGRLVG